MEKIVIMLRRLTFAFVVTFTLSALVSVPINMQIAFATSLDASNVSITPSDSHNTFNLEFDGTEGASYVYQYVVYTPGQAPSFTNIPCYVTTSCSINSLSGLCGSCVAVNVKLQGHEDWDAEICDVAIVCNECIDDLAGDLSGNETDSQIAEALKDFFGIGAVLITWGTAVYDLIRYAASNSGTSGGGNYNPTVFTYLPSPAYVRQQFANWHLTMYNNMYVETWLSNGYEGPSGSCTIYGEISLNLWANDIVEICIWGPWPPYYHVSLYP